RLRTYVQKLQEELLNKIDKASRSEIKAMPHDVDRALHALSVRLSQELDYRFKVLADRVLSQMFPPHELAQVIGRINAQLRMQSGSKPRREGSSDNAMLVMSSAGTAMMGSRVVTMVAGGSAIAASTAASVAVAASGIGLGLAAAGYMMYRRKVSQ